MKASAKNTSKTSPVAAGCAIFLVVGIIAVIAGQDWDTADGGGGLQPATHQLPTQTEQAREQTETERPDFAPQQPPDTTNNEFQHGHCGSADVTGPAEAGDWPGYGCAPSDIAGSRWSECFERVDYTTDQTMGCPDDERCCPPYVVETRQLCGDNPLSADNEISRFVRDTARGADRTRVSDCSPLVMDVMRCWETECRVRTWSGGNQLFEGLWKFWVRQEEGSLIVISTDYGL